MTARVIAVAVSPKHTMSKPVRDRIRLIEGHGVEGDAHMGKTVKHRSRVHIDPAAPNLRQVHLIHAELFDELRTKGFDIAPGQMGENITTRGLDLLALPRGTHLHIGTAAIEVTGLRNPCTQLDGIQPGLMEAVLERHPERGLIRKAGIMAVVAADGEVTVDNTIRVTLPAGNHEPLKPV
ncbi:MAG: MOSC domain-containing protein [Alphaproteobacteria bacterium]|nr:MOSC domain-containing protein [Alphaproteobacteria bacterium]